jgi:hypothetical protein
MSAAELVAAGKVIVAEPLLLLYPEGPLYRE